MAEHAGIWASAMRMSEHRCFLENRRGSSRLVLRQWSAAHGGGDSDYNSFISKRGWHDDESDGPLPEMIKRFDVRNDGSVLTYFDLIEMDEGRWYPDIWRNAWR
jgi:hypothetical protein